MNRCQKLLTSMVWLSQFYRVPAANQSNIQRLGSQMHMISAKDGVSETVIRAFRSSVGVYLNHFWDTKQDFNDWGYTQIRPEYWNELNEVATREGLCNM